MWVGGRPKQELTKWLPMRTGWEERATKRTRADGDERPQSGEQGREGAGTGASGRSFSQRLASPLCAPPQANGQARRGRADGPGWLPRPGGGGMGPLPSLARASHGRPPRHGAAASWGHLETQESVVQAGPHHPAQEAQSLEFPKRN